MSTVQMHYDGWLRLPDEVLRQLAITTGSRMDVEVMDMKLMLRPMIQSEQSAALKPKADEAEPASEPQAVLKRRPGRPRKT